MSFDCQPCRVPARRPGNFHLRPQMKVTKAKGPNATPIWPSRFGQSAQRDTCYAVLHRTDGSLDDSARFASPRGGGAYRAASRVQARRCQAAEALRPNRCCIEAVCFGDFHLGQQMKVTRPPGRDPARRHEPVIQRTKGRVRNGPPADRRRSTAFHASRVARSAVGQLK